MGSVFDDGTALTIHQDLDKTCASIARFSQKDADTFRRLFEETKGYMDLILTTLMFTPPLSMNDITKALVAWGVEEKAEFLSVHLRRLDINQFLDQHFENDKVKAHIAFHTSLGGYSTDRKGLATTLPLLVGKIDNWHVCVGGSHALAHALWEGFAQAGGRVFLQHGVDRILVEGGQAVGVVLEGGAEIRARQLVASSINLEQTLLKMLAPGVLPEGFAEAAEQSPHMDWSYFSVHLAMTRAPEYKAAQFDPDIDKAWVVNVGYDSPEAINQHWKAIRAGKLPSACPNAAVNSLFDPTDAPEGHYTGLLRHYAPYSLSPGGPEAWDPMAKEFAVACIEKWQEAAPNLKDGAILDWATYTPLDITRRIPNMVQGDWMGGLIDLDNMLDQRPFPELSQYATPVKGLYMCGATQHPHGFITFAPAYNALQVIADDYDLERWWR
jgi:phytoene dehydrogenase-like protein